MCESICVRLVTFFCGLGFCFFAVQPGISAHLGQPAHLEISETEPIIERGFMLNDPNYAANRLVYGERMDALTARLIARQKEGGELACSDQMLIEARWLLEHTTDWARLDAQLARLAESLNHTDQTFATLQSPRDGAWGVCYNEWFHKLDATVDGLNALADNGEAPRYPLVFLRRIADRDSLLSYLEGLLVSDIERTGVDQRDELGAVTGALSQMLFKSYLRRLLDIDPQGFVVTDGYVDAYREFLDSWQEPSTGYWGAWYRTDSGLHKSTDLSLTFHTVSYRRGDVERWPELIDTTLAIKKLEYSYGWMHNGTYNHHNNYDVVKIFRYGWPQATGAQRERMRAELEAMLEWCFSMPMGSDNVFAIDPTFYSNAANYYYFGVSFLDEIGYWDRSRRFWTDRNFSGADALCQTTKSRLTSLDLDSPASEAAMRKLEANCPAG